MERHNRGASRYTKSKRPWKLEHTEEYKTKKEALKREKYLKGLKSRGVLEYLIENRKLPWK
ncbi:MAG: GIY-YIG nuclease family protein [Patescibacteria group bacterium]